MTGTTILGRYLSKMKLMQYKDARWDDTETLMKLQEARVRDTMRRSGFSAAEIDKAIMEGQIPMPVPPVAEIPENAQAVIQREVQHDFGLTEEDKLYLGLKWGKGYREEEWVQLEQFYNDMMNSYDIQTSGHRDTLKLVCKSSLKANQLIDIGDVDGYQKVSKVYNDLMKSGNFTAAQNKAEQGEYVDSISELVAICETSGFIPRYYVDDPKDKVDRVLQDLQGYTQSLIMEETNLSNMIEGAMKQIANDKEKAEKIVLEDEDDDDALLAQLESSLFTPEDNVELTDADFEEWNEWQDGGDE